MVITGLVHRIGWTFIDQIVSSGTNFILMILLARNLPAAEFGAFALLYGYYVLCVQLTQTAFAEPLIVRFPRTPGSARRALSHSSGLAAIVGLLGGAALIPLSIPMVGGITAPAIVLAAALPVLLVQDTLRMGFIATGQPRKAVVSDVAWGIGQCLATLAVLSVTRDLVWVLLAWGFGGLVAAGLAMAQARVVPRISSARDWLRSYGDLARPYLVEGVVLTICAYATLLVVGKIAGLAAAGSLRASDTLFGPASVLIGAGRVIGTSELSRLAADRPHRIGCGAILVTVALGTVGAVAGLVAMALPSSVGVSLFGDSWRTMVPLLPALTVYRIGQGAVLGPATALRAMQAVWALFAFRLAGAVALITAAAVGAGIAGARGAAVSLAITMTLSCLTATALYAYHRRRIIVGRSGPAHAFVPGQGDRVDDQDSQSLVT